MLEKAQKSSCDVTEWLKWFLEMFIRSIDNSKDVVNKALAIARFWQTHNQTEFNERQLKVITKLLEAGREGFEGGLTNRKYVSINRVSRETGKRDLAELEQKGILQRNEGGGRSVSYSLKP